MAEEPEAHPKEVVRRSFTLEPAPVPEKEIMFDVNGREFHCIGRVPLGVWLRLREGDEQKPVTERRTQSESLDEFIRGVLVVEDEAAWDALLSDKELAPEPQILTDVFNFLVEAYSGRPTNPPSDSSTTPGTTEDSSTASS